jgi:hypothetical protein
VLLAKPDEDAAEDETPLDMLDAEAEVAVAEGEVATVATVAVEDTEEKRQAPAERVKPDRQPVESVVSVGRRKRRREERC